MVFLSLTNKGRKIDSVHRYFHEQMVRNVSSELSEDERNVLIKGIGGLNSYFKRKTAEMEVK